MCPSVALSCPVCIEYETAKAPVLGAFILQKGVKMRKFYTKTIAAIFAFAAITAGAVPACAAAGFVDVARDSPWYESVTYLADKGITNGVGSQRYAPDERITVSQWATMLCRVFDQGRETSLARAYHNGWLSVSAGMAPDSAVCRGELYQSAFAAGGVQIYDFALYPDGEPLSDYDNCMRVGAELGLCAENTNPMELVTRGEAAEVLYAVLTRDIHVEAPPMVEELPIRNNAGAPLNDYLVELNRVPEALLQRFKREGWTYCIDCAYLSEMSREYHASCVGATVYAEKTIYVSEAGSTLHEFGHYLYHILGYPSQVEQLYRDEAEAASIFLRDYALTNCREYFADYFAHYIKCAGNAGKVEQMMRRTPETYAFFQMLLK